MTTQFKDLVPCPIREIPNTYQEIHSFARMLIGSEIGARYLVAALASKVITIFFYNSDIFVFAF